MNRLDTPVHATRDEAADVLRENGYRFGNNVIGATLKGRCPSPSPGKAHPADG